MQDSKVQGDGVPTGGPDLDLRVARAAASPDRVERSAVGVLLVIAHRLLRDGIAELIAPRVQLLGAVGAAEEAIGACERTRPHVAVVEVGPGDTGAIALVRALIERRLARRVVVIAPVDDPDLALQVLDAGATGFLPTDAGPDELLRAVASVDRGDLFLTPSVTRFLVTRAVRVGASLPRGEHALNAGEIDVLVLVAKGRSNQEIARELIVSESTVKARIGRLFSKLRCRDRAQLVVVAYETGLVQPGSGAVEPWWPRG